MSTTEEAIDKFKSRRARVGVLGLGCAGLPLACAFAEASIATCGFDIDQQKIERLNRGKSYIDYIAAGRVTKLAKSG